MKKYVKPEFFYERYELAQHIADCSWEIQLADDSQCIATPDEKDYPGMPTLFNNTSICEMTPDVLEEYCYHSGAQGINVFAS